MALKIDVCEGYMNGTLLRSFTNADSIFEVKQ